MTTDPSEAPADPTPPDRRTALQLVAIGAAILLWELALIRWLGSTIRVVAYFTNFILISAFLGLGVGALLTRRRDLSRGLVPALSLTVLIGPVLGAFSQTNPKGEYLWLGSQAGRALDWLPRATLPYWLVLGLVFLLSTGVFALFGQRLGRLFRELPPLQAYSLEVGGSLLGILAFGLLSFLTLTPTVWFGLGFVILAAVGSSAATARGRRVDLAVLVVCAAATLGLSRPVVNDYHWSPYYKIKLNAVKGQTVTGEERVIGYGLQVNNDYYQNILDLSPRAGEPQFLQDWRACYEFPHRAPLEPAAGPILILGAGTGNDVAAALRRTEAQIDAVEIDPVILALGREHHPEQPYASPRVRVIVDDARSHLTHADGTYAKVIFGLLDSHTLLSSFTTLRLDNFVYTRESLQRVKQLLRPGGEVYLSFSKTEPWINARLIKLMDEVFEGPTQAYTFKANAIICVNRRREAAEPLPAARARELGATRVTTDDWPFLYLREASVPGHYRWFIALVLALSVSSLFLLPKGQRVVELPFFFMGAGFFLIETSNVVKLALLYGSTWVVNMTVFGGILALVLLGNLASTRLTRDRYSLLFGVLIVWCGLSYLIQPADLLGLDSRLLQAALATLVFLGPVFVASIIFARLIQGPVPLDQAYGSNLLGAMVGGAAEYGSLALGFQALVGLSMAFYALALATLLHALRKQRG